MKKLTLIIAFLFAIAPIAQAQISNLEKEALIDLYKSTNGESWNTTWNTNENVNTWFGVTVENNVVTGLQLNMNNLNGIIPSSIKNLKNLKVLDLGFNKISGIIPTEITSINTLESIQLYMNQLEGEIPQSIGNLSNLKELVLFNNLLSGMWWQDRASMQGQVGHEHQGRKHTNKYSGTFGENLKEVVVIDGLFMCIHKGRVKHNFNEQFEGFHFYDLPICLENH